MDIINITPFVNLGSPTRKSRLIHRRNELEFALDATKYIQKTSGKFQISLGHYEIPIG